MSVVSGANILTNCCALNSVSARVCVCVFLVCHGHPTTHCVHQHLSKYNTLSLCLLGPRLKLDSLTNNNDEEESDGEDGNGDDT